MAIQDTINHSISTVTGALVAQKHLDNQEKAQEMSFVKQQNDLEFGIEDSYREEANLHAQMKANENDITNNEIDLNEQKKLNEIAKFTADNTEPGSPENTKAMDDLKAIGKSMTELNRQAAAQQITKENIATQYDKVQQIRDMKRNELDLLRKQNQKLAIKYPLGGTK